MKEIPTRYDHTKEKDMYAAWEKSGQFSPQGEGPTFSLVLPPPNVTGDLHMGHAVSYTIPDVIARYHRMVGDKVLMIPGADHASIAVHNLVEKKVQKELGQTRHQLGRERFLEQVWEWIEHYLPRIKESLKRFGVSADWTRFRFTMDEHSSLAVRTAFVELYKKDLIYKAEGIVNWDPKLQTTVSDDEVEYVEEKSPFYIFQYGPFQIGTARPETKFGDKYVVMHPDDKRYAQYKHGDTFTAEWINGPITATVIKDKVVDPEFGTGVMTITPWHDPIDFELATRHQLDKEPIIDLRGRLLSIAGELAGEKITDAREKIVAKLKAKGLLVKIDEHYTHRVATNYRGGGKIEPQILPQWFMRTTALKDQARQAVKKGQITFVPKNIEKVYFHWLDKLHDWNISRQLWWGHQLPVYYCQNDPAQAKYVVELAKPKSCPFCGKCAMEQSEETLDTWFSSGLWPMTTLGWPLKTDDYQKFFPTTFMVMGTDILFFWASRMIMMSLALTGEIPFKTVFFHGLVLDEQGKKMSKSKGNVLDPMTVIDQYGADTLRLALLGDVTTWQNQRMSPTKLMKYRNFITKVWNASRFTSLATPQAKADQPVKPLDETEKKFFAALEKLEQQYDKLMRAHKLNLALEALYEFFWHRFCDQFLESQKESLRSETNPKDNLQRQTNLRHALDRLLKLLANFAPFVTTSIHQEMFDE